MLGIQSEKEDAKYKNLLILIGKLVVSKFKYGEHKNIVLYEQEKSLRIK